MKGFLGILPGHAPLVTLLKAGLLKYLPEKSNQWQKTAIGWGYLELIDDQVRVLAESAATKHSLDKAKSEKALKKVLESLKKTDLEPKDREKLEKEKLRLVAELAL